MDVMSNEDLALIQKLARQARERISLSSVDRVLGEYLELAVLKEKKRDKLPDSAFAIPEKRKYPIHDEAHARNALARVAQFGTPEEKKRVRAAVHRKYPNIDVEGISKEGEEKAKKKKGKD